MNMGSRVDGAGKAGVRGWGAAFALWRIWTHLGWRDIKVRYALTVLGPFWAIFNALAVALAIGIVYSAVFGIPFGSYFAYVLTGLTAWGFLSASISESTGQLQFYRSLVLNTRLPLPVYSMAIVWRNLAILGMSFPVVLLLVVISLQAIPITIPWVIPGAALVVMAALPGGYLLGLLGQRFPDTSMAVPSLLFLVFLSSPILWNPELVDDRTWVYRFNPVYWALSLIRDPLIGVVPSREAWTVTFGLAAVLWAGALMAARSSLGRRVVYYL